MDSHRYPYRCIVAISCILLVSAVFAAGCAQPEATPAASTTPEPAPTETSKPSPTSSLTAEPTNTATTAPTETPKPSPTPPPDYKATHAVEATQTAEAVVADISAKMEVIGAPLPEGHLGWYQQEPITIDMDAYMEAFYWELDEDLNAADFILKTNITWRSSGGLMTCGFLFRSEANMEEGAHYKYDMIRLSGLPAWNILFVEFGEFQKNVTGVLTSGAIDQDQASTNEIILMAEGEKFTLYINEERIGSYYDYSKSRLDGYLAFTGSQESGSSTCDFDNSWIWIIEK